jgi:cysteine-rich repeat protein
MMQISTGKPAAVQFLLSIVAMLLVALPSHRAEAVDYVGTVDFQGDVTFSAPIAGISEQDLTISVKEATDATGQGTKCSITATTSDNADALGDYPDAGSVDADYLVERGGPNLPEGTCVTTVVAAGTDGVSVSARGTQTIFVDVNDVDASATVVVPTIVVRQSKAIAGVDKDCLKWMKKQMKLRAKCSYKVLKKGADKADTCKDAGPEPTLPELCDPGDFVEAVLAFSHGANDFQLDPFSAPDVDEKAHKDQIKCQKRFGKAAVNFIIKYTKLVDKKCVQAGLDSEECRVDLVNAKNIKKKLDQIDKCVTDQIVDGGTGTIIPEVGDPCMSCISGSVLDRKCMKGCFESHLIVLGDGMVGDFPECGNGILQSPEFCDDGNLVNGDCCSDICTVEAGSTEGPNGDLTCSDLLDNDCDGDIDGADADCQ